MNIQRLALLANGRSRACGKCPLGVANCTDTIKKICRDAFVEGYKKGYEQSKKDNRSTWNDVMREYCKKGGVL